MIRHNLGHSSIEAHLFIVKGSKQDCLHFAWFQSSNDVNIGSEFLGTRLWTIYNSDIYVPKCWLDFQLKGDSWLVLVLKLQTSELREPSFDLKRLLCIKDITVWILQKSQAISVSLSLTLITLCVLSSSYFRWNLPNKRDSAKKKLVKTQGVVQYFNEIYFLTLKSAAIFDEF